MASYNFGERLSVAGMVGGEQWSVVGSLPLVCSYSRICFSSFLKLSLEESSMSSTTISTVTKMLESLPELAQARVVEQLHDYIENLRDELRWNQTFKKTSSKLVKAARQARQEATDGKAQAMDFEKL